MILEKISSIRERVKELRGLVRRERNFYVYLLTLILHALEHELARKNGVYDCIVCGEFVDAHEGFMISDKLWKMLYGDLKGGEGFVHVRHLELSHKIKRFTELHSRDFTKAPINDLFWVGYRCGYREGELSWMSKNGRKC